MRHVVLGLGEVGDALLSILKDAYGDNAIGFDIDYSRVDNVYFLHICFPYSDVFLGQVSKYIGFYSPKYTVVHSTVPVGTCDKIGAIHSPVRGQHYDMKTSLKTFVKYVGGPRGDSDAVANEFLRAGIPVHVVGDAKSSELSKILCTTLYGVMIRFAKDVDKYCLENGLTTSDVLTLWTKTYNDGYARLGHPEYIRPIIEPLQIGIGGHCIIPNTELLPKDFSEWAKIVRKG